MIASFLICKPYCTFKTFKGRVEITAAKLNIYSKKIKLKPHEKLKFILYNICNVYSLFNRLIKIV